MPTAIYHQVRKQLEQYIRQHDVHGKLPGLHKLSTIFGVNHITLRKAVEELANDGKLEVIPSRGIFVREPMAAGERHHLIGLLGLCESQQTREIYLEQQNQLLASAGYQVMEVANNPKLYKENPRLLLMFPIDGYIFLGTTINRAILETLLQNHRPAICTINPLFPEINHIGLDHMKAYRNALRELRQHGCKRIGLLEYQRTPDFQNYLEDIRQAFQEELGELFDPQLFVICDANSCFMRHGERYHEILTRETWQKWEQHPPDGIITNAQVSQQIKKIRPDILTVAFTYVDNQSDADIDMIADTPRLLRCASQKMIDILNGDTSITETKVPFIETRNRE